LVVAGGEPPATKAERLKAQAKSIDHQVLHSCKNGQCEFCLRGRMLSHYTHSVRPEAAEEETAYLRPAKFGDLISADNIIASDYKAGSQGEKTALYIRDQYSGVGLAYVQNNRTEDNNYKSMKHFAGEKLNGSSTTVFKSDNAKELTNSAHRLAWVPDPSLANKWPHNAACERDIRSLKEICRPSHLQAGFPKQAWPVSLDYTSKARSFYEQSPIHELETGTDAETDKMGKSKWEVATGSPFLGAKYPLGALVYYKAAGDGLAEANTRPGLFAGWTIAPGLRYKEIVRILDLEDIRTNQATCWTPKDNIHQREVFFPPAEHIEYPLANAARIAIRDTTCPQHELRKSEYDKSLERGVLPYDVIIDSLPETTPDRAERPLKLGIRIEDHARITIQRLIKDGSTPGCPGCEGGNSDHNAACRARFDAIYRPPTASSSAASSSTDIPHAGVCKTSDTDEPEPAWALVTRLLERSEMIANPKALEAVHKEAVGLEAKNTWDLATVVEKDDLLAAARRDGRKLHIGSLMSICSEKFAELEEAFRVLKGRIVYRGDCAKDEQGAYAVYQNMTASPTSIQAANANIAYGQVPGHKTSSADAVKAYVQALLMSEHPTWIQMPRELWPPEWKGKYRCPVVLLIKSLYGHPESGAHWENHLTAMISKHGGASVPGQPSSFWFKKEHLLLTVYVDDFLLSGPEEQHDQLWEKLAKDIDLEDFGGLGRFLGRHHEIALKDDKPAVSFNMSDYVSSACDLYESLPGAKPLNLKAATPFVPEGSLLPEDDLERGELAPNACKILMKDLWVARLARPDLFKAICALATKVQRWTRNCDRMLYRLMCYMKRTIDYRLYGYVRDKPENLRLDLYVDADFAGDREDSYSTSGGWLVLAGPDTYFPLCWVSKKQTSVSRSTTESEIVSLAHSLFLEALPMCTLWDTILGREVDLHIHEDNEAAILVINKGFSSKLRHILRTHKVNIQSIKDEVDKPHTHLKHVSTDKQAADIFTKALEPQKWQAALDMLHIATVPLEIIGEITAGFKKPPKIPG
jgi:hypothetical protein